MNNNVITVLNSITGEMILESYNIEWTRSGDELSFCCPFHDDSHPSMSMNDETTLYYCHACNESGNGIQFIQEMDETDFFTALKKAAKMAEINLNFTNHNPEEDKMRNQRINSTERIINLAETLLWSSTGKSALQYLYNRGITEDSVRKFRLGYLNLPLVIRYLNGEDLNTEIEMKSKVLASISFEDLKISGLIKFFENGNDSEIKVKEAVVFPILDSGKAISLAFRNINQESEKRWVFPFKVEGFGIDNLFNEKSLNNKSQEITLCEGAMDVIALDQWGISAVGALGLGSAKRFADKFKNQKRVYLLLDNDEAGQKALINTAQAIQKELLDGEVYLPSLPDGIKDPNEWLQKDGNPEEAKRMISQSPTLIEYLISQMQHIENKRDQKDALETVIGIVSALSDDFLKEQYLEDIKKVFGRSLPKSVIRESLKNNSSNSDVSELQEFSYSESRSLHPALDFEFGEKSIAQCLVAERTENENTWSILRVIKKDNEVFSEKRNLELNNMPAVLTADERVPWLTNPKNKFSANSFLKGEAPDVSTGEIYKEVLDSFKKFIWLKHEEDYHVLASFTLATYVYRIFMAFPYLWINGNKSSGKSTTMGIMHSLAFQAQYTSNIKPASVFRTVDVLRPTFLIDEAEFLREGNFNFNELIGLFNDGYKKGASVKRIIGEGESMRTGSFDVYCPKALASIKPISPILASRCIKIELISANQKQVSEINSLKLDYKYAVEQLFPNIRNRLFCWMLQHFCHVNIQYEHTIKTTAKIDKMTGREFELWTPLFTIGILADADIKLDAFNSLYRAWESRNRARDIESLDNQEKIIWATYTVLSSPDYGGLETINIEKKNLVEQVNKIAKSYLGWDFDLKSNRLTMALNSIEAIINEKRVLNNHGSRNSFVTIELNILKDFLETRINLVEQAEEEESEKEWVWGAED